MLKLTEKHNIALCDAASAIYWCNWGDNSPRMFAGIKSMHRMSMSVCAVSMLCAGNAVADTAHLKGDYAYSQTTSCMTSPSGFNAQQQALGPTTISNEVDQGIRHFDGRGTGTYNNNAASFFGSLEEQPLTNFSIPAASQSQSVAQFSYVVQGNQFTVSLVGSASGTILTGTRAGQTYTLTGLLSTTGYITDGGKTLIATTVTPSVETISYSNGQSFPRICVRHVIYSKIGE